MAKQRPKLSLERMETDLGYKVDALNSSESSMTFLYTDLRPVERGIYEKTLREFEESERQKACRNTIIRNSVLPRLGKSKIIAHGRDTVSITRTSSCGFYSFTGNVHYDFGLNIALLLTMNEASEILHVSQLNSRAFSDLGPLFSKLTREIREKIYDFTIPNGTWKPEDINTPKCGFSETIGDLTGFYYPLSNLSILSINKKMRQEILAFTYRSTMFQLDDMDELIKLLMAIGRIGRDNIKSMEFAWQSKIDLEQQWSITPNSAERSLSLPTRHVSTCLQLLRQCKNLKFLGIFFDDDLVLNIPPSDYAIETGLHDLCSIRGIERVEIRGLAFQQLKQHIFATKLREAMQSSRQETENSEESNTV